MTLSYTTDNKPNQGSCFEYGKRKKNKQTKNCLNHKFNFSTQNLAQNKNKNQQKTLGMHAAEMQSTPQQLLVNPEREREGDIFLKTLAPDMHWSRL